MIATFDFILTFCALILFLLYNLFPFITKTAVSDGHGGEFSSVFNIPNSPTGGDSFQTVATPEQILGMTI